MTCVVAIKAGGKVWMGADAAGVSGLDIRHRADSKVFRNGDFLFGCTTSFRMTQLLRYAMVPPACGYEQSVQAFMVTDFVNAVRECLKAGGWSRKDAEVESGGTFLVGYRGRLFRIDSDYQVGCPADDFDACGCGENYALGALHAMEDMGGSEGFSPERRLQRALEAAQRFSAGVRGPFTFEAA